ncbi:MAG: DUF4249 family protein [Bacteroidota bacterium]
MKNRYINGFLAPLLLLTISSCEEVIDIDLNSASPVVVAEGYMDMDSLCTIRLSYTTGYFQEEDPELIEDATVAITDETGASEILHYSGNGIYRGDSMRGKVNGRYTATIRMDDMVFSGFSTLMPVPLIDSINYEDFPFAGHPGAELPQMLVISLKRDPGRENHFMLKFRHNGEPVGSSFDLATDSYASAGDVVQYTTFLMEHESGDTLSVEIYAIDADLLRYYSQINEAISGGMGMSTTPYNPASNLGDGILGYFMVRSRRDTILILP